jgi:MFS transporter, FHS family, L-fucose permease
VGVGLLWFIKPRWIFLAFQLLVIVFLAPAITQRGDIGVSMLFVVLFFESICFPTIVALGMKGLGRHSKRGSGWIVAGVIGGACVPPLTGYSGDVYGTGTAMFVPLIFFLGSLSYAICVNFVPYYRDTIDAVNDTPVGVQPRGLGDVEAPGVEKHHVVEEKPNVLGSEKV